MIAVSTSCHSEVKTKFRLSKEKKDGKAFVIYNFKAVPFISSRC